MNIDELKDYFETHPRLNPNHNELKWVELGFKLATKNVKGDALLHSVTNQRGLLIAFMEYLSELSMGIDEYDQKKLLDDFESNL